MSEKEQPLKNRSDNTLFNTLYKINVKDVTEKRNNLTYLSWAWAWAEVSKVCEAVDYEIYHDPETYLPYVFDKKTGYMVFTSITVNGVKRDMWLPVMDGANKAMKDEPYTYEVNDSYVSSTLRALSQMITDELAIKLGINVELDFSTLTGQDKASRMNKAMEDGNGGDGYLLINEVRDYYGLPSIPNGDVLYTKTTAKGGGNSGNGNSEFSGNPVNGESND